MTSTILSDEDAERVVLGSVMVNNALMPQVESLLRAEHFSRHAHRAIYSAQVELYASGTGIDLISLRESLGKALDASGGISYLASLIDGVPMSDNLEGWCRIVRDKARRRAALALARKLAQEAEFGEMETDELLDSHQSVLARLIQADDRKLRRMGDFLPEVLSNLEAFVVSRSGITGVETGIDDFDRLTCGLGKGWLAVIGARSGRGKSALCAQAAVHAASQGKRVLVFAMETPGPEMVQRTLLSEAGVNRWQLKSAGFDGDPWRRVMRTYGLLKELPIWIDCSEMPTLAHVRAVAQQQKTRNGLDLLVVDHLQRMHCDPKQERWIAVGETARGLKSLALRLEVPVVATCQLNSEAQEKRPSMANLQQAQSIISAEADIVALIHPEKPEEWSRDPAPAATLIVDKNRHGQGMDIRLVFLKDQVRFGSAQPEQFFGTA